MLDISPSLEFALGSLTAETELAEFESRTVLSSYTVMVSRYLARLRCGTDAGATDCRNGSKVVVGSAWRLNLNNPSVRTTKQPRVQWEPFECSNRFRTVSNTNVRKFAASNPASAGIGLHGFMIGYNFLATFSRMSETRIRRGFQRPRKVPKNHIHLLLC